MIVSREKKVLMAHPTRPHGSAPYVSSFSLPTMLTKRLRLTTAGAGDALLEETKEETRMEH